MLIDIVRNKMRTALKNGETDERVTLSLLLGALESMEKNKKAQLTPDEESMVVMRIVKQIKETLDSAPENRTDIKIKAQRELEILQEFVPDQMTEDEIEAKIVEVLLELDLFGEATMKHKGVIMKNLMPMVKGKADGKLVNKVLERILNK